MGLSDSHIRLVQALKNFVEDEYGRERKLIIFADNPDSAFQDHVPNIGGSLPDLYARCYGPDLIILGEAKTVHDVQTRHSIMQYEHLLLYCARHPGSHLVFAVPWTVVPCLKNIIRNLKRRLYIDNLDPVFLEPLPE